MNIVSAIGKIILQFQSLTEQSENNIKKVVSITIKITKDEAHHLANNGFRWHSDIMHTWSKRKKYYACQGRKVMKALDDYRQVQKND